MHDPKNDVNGMRKTISILEPIPKFLNDES